MTRKEAIKYLGWLRNETNIVEYREAIPMAIDALREQEERRWIPVEERLPDFELVDAKNDGFDLCSCLVTVKNFRVKNGRYVKKAWYNGYGFRDENGIIITKDVTHWMPLPEPPKEDT